MPLTTNDFVSARLEGPIINVNTLFQVARKTCVLHFGTFSRTSFDRRKYDAVLAVTNYTLRSLYDYDAI